MKFNLSTITLKTTAALCMVAVVGCGGSDPNSGFSLPSDHIATCSKRANWEMIKIGLSYDNVVSILGKPSTGIGQTLAGAYTWGACDLYLVETTPEDLVTAGEQRKVERIYRSGFITFDKGERGFVTKFEMPTRPTQKYFYVFSEDEMLRNVDPDTIVAKYCKPTKVNCDPLPII